MIVIKNLHITKGQNAILKGINLKIKQGETLSIIGPSGGGKSTLLRAMNYMEAPTEGCVLIDEVLLNEKNAPEVRKHIGMVFQHFNLFPHKSVLDNIIYAPIEVLKQDSRKATQKAYDLLEQVGLKDKAQAYPNNLSGGQKQRVAIARALAINPNILLFDEPTSALDPEMVKEVLEVIQKLAHHGITIIIVTHEMKFAKNISDRILFLSEGILLEDTSSEIFFTQPSTERARIFLNNMLL